MEKLIALQQKVAPEMTEIIERRYAILRNIYFNQPIGRRMLSNKLNEQERSVRREVDFLREQGLVYADGTGMKLTAESESLIADLREYVSQLRGLSSVEDILKQKFNLKKVIVVPGDSDVDDSVKKELARAAAKYLKSLIKDGDIIAVTGGTTMAEVAEAIIPHGTKRDVTVVPARGGMGEDVEKQADTVAAFIAKRLGGSYRLLNIPEDLGMESIEKVSTEPRIEALLSLIRRATIVFHGIGTAEEMARRRRLSQSQVEMLTQRGAVGEAFGYYFNSSGQIVYSTSSVGLRFDDLANVGKIIAVGGGSTKAEAVAAVMQNNYQEVLITDEGVARRIVDILRI